MSYEARRRQLLDDHARIVARRAPRALEATAIRTRSPAIRELLAHLATGGRASSAELTAALDAAEATGSRPSLAHLEPIDPSWLARFARATTLQRLDRGDRKRTLTCYRALFERGELVDTEIDHRRLYGQLLFEEGCHAELRDRLPALELEDDVRRGIELDLANPVLGGGASTWLQALNDLLGTTGPLQVGLASAGATPFDRLVAGPGETVDGPLVSVVVSCYRPDPVQLATAVGSILAQTWANLELLLVDDASPSEHQAIIEQLAGEDDRIRLVRRPVNGGTYRVRNTALSLARGDFVTFQDADDWSHPSRLERQVAPLLGDGRLVATTSRCARVTEELFLTEAGYRGSLVPNASSLLFRRDPVVTQLGFFDEVRRGADNEYRLRLRARFGDVEHPVEEPVLAFVRRTHGSLSRRDFTPGWQHPARAAYKASYGAWHARVRRGGPAFLPRDAHPRPFPAPAPFRSRRVDPYHLDVVFVGDWRAYGGPQRSMVEEIQAAREAGHRVGVAHLEALRFMNERDVPLCAPVLDLVARGEVTWVLADDPAVIDLVIVRYPPVLQFPPPVPVAWRAAHVWIVANQAPCERDGSDRRYLVEDVEAGARQVFGTDPTWVPQGPTVRTALEREPVPPSALAPFDDPGIVRPQEWYSERQPWLREVPRVGRYSRDNVMKFPADADALLATYDDPGVHLTVMGGTTTIPRLLGDRPVPDNWVLLRQNRHPVEDVLRRIDFFVYFDHPSSHEAFGRSVLEAIASGCVVIVPDHFQPLFEDAAIYTSGPDAMSVVHRLHRDRAAYEAQVQRARAVVERRFSYRTFQDRLAAALVAARAAAADHGTLEPATAAGTGPMPPVRDPDRADRGPLAHGFVVTEAAVEPPAAAAAWPSDAVGARVYRWHPSTRWVRERVGPRDRLRDPYDVVLIGHPGDPGGEGGPTTDLALVASRTGDAYAAGGLPAAARYAAGLVGRFVAFVHDGHRTHVLPDVGATQTTYWSVSRCCVAVGSHASLVAESLGRREDGTTQAVLRRHARGGAAPPLPGLRTHFVGVRPVLAGSTLTIDHARGSVTHRWWRSAGAAVPDAGRRRAALEEVAAATGVQLATAPPLRADPALPDPPSLAHDLAERWSAGAAHDADVVESFGELLAYAGLDDVASPSGRLAGLLTRAHHDTQVVGPAAQRVDADARVVFLDP